DYLIGIRLIAHEFEAINSRWVGHHHHQRLPKDEVLDLIFTTGWHGSCSPLRSARLMATPENLEDVVNLYRHGKGRGRWCRKRWLRRRGSSSGRQASNLRRLSQAPRYTVAPGDQASSVVMAGRGGRG